MNDKIDSWYLTLPLEKQRQIAKEDGYGDDLEAWQSEMQKSHDEAQAHIASLKTVSYDSLTPNKNLLKIDGNEKLILEIQYSK
jgi:hypothetical protein